MEAQPASARASATLAYLRWFLVLLLAGVVVGGSAYAILTFHNGDSRNRQAYQLGFGHIEHPPLPPCVPDRFLAEVRVLGTFPEVLDTGEADLLERLHQAFAKHPWVERVDRVVKPSPQRIRVELHFRQPVAVVVVGKERHAVDRHGVLLPKGDGKLPSLLEVWGVTDPPSGPPGTPWGDPSVAAAARLADIVRRDREYLELVAIAVGVDPLEPDLRLRTKGGSQVIWSSLPDEEPASHEEKLKLLRAYREQHRSLDLPDGPYRLDLRQPSSGIIRQRLAGP